MAIRRSLPLTELEAWAIEDMVRHTWNDEGRPVGRSLLLKIMALLDEFEQRRGQPHPPRDLPLVLSEEECWAVDFHIRRGHVDPTGVRVGRELLYKVFRLLLDLRAADEVRSLGLPDALADEADPDVQSRLSDLHDFLERNLGRDDENEPINDESAESRD